MLQFTTLMIWEVNCEAIAKSRNFLIKLWIGHNESNSMSSTFSDIIEWVKNNHILARFVPSGQEWYYLL